MELRSQTSDIYRVPIKRNKIRGVIADDYFAIVIRNILSQVECEELIQRSNDVGYEPALLNIGGDEQILATDTRKSDRCIIDDPSLAELIWSRIKSKLEAFSDIHDDSSNLLHIDKLQTPTKSRYPVGLNERLRFLRYNPGDYFQPHMDGCYIRNDEAGESRRGEESFVTCQLYLNEKFEGGATTFHSSWKGEYSFDVIPETGSVLLFQHDLIHEGSMLVKGTKYAIRTDVMYTDKGPGHEYSKKPIRLKTMPPSP